MQPVAVVAQVLVIHVVAVMFAIVTGQLYIFKLPAPVDKYVLVDSKLAILPAIPLAN